MFPINQVVQGDCTRVLKQLPDSCVDLVVTDPPYGVHYRDRLGRTIANDDDPARVLNAFTDLYRALKPGSVCISFYGWGLVDSFFRAWRWAGFRPIGHIVWVKDYASRERFLRYRHEQAFVLAKGHPQVPARPLDDVQPWVFSGNVDHPTQKDVRILRPLVEAFTPPGQLVLDPFAGSGSTLLAAAMSGRRYLGIELEQRYCDLARNRLARVERRDAAQMSERAADRESRVDPQSVAALGGLHQWLRDHDHLGLAQTVRAAMDHRRV